jgi:hypothetical protein
MRSSAPIIVQSVRSLVAGGAGGKVDVTIEREDMKTKGYGARECILWQSLRRSKYFVLLIRSQNVGSCMEILQIRYNVSLHTRFECVTVIVEYSSLLFRLAGDGMPLRFQEQSSKGDKVWCCIDHKDA